MGVMGRPRKKMEDKAVPFGFKIPPKLYQGVVELAERLETTRSDIIHQAINEFLEKNKKS